MKQPRKPAEILEEIRELDSLIVEGDALQRQFQEDKFLNISQNQARNRKSNLVMELSESQKFYGQQTFVLAFDKHLSGIDAHVFPAFIRSITDILDQTQKVLTNDQQNHVPLLFNGVVQSSFGLHFTINDGQNLFGNDYDNLLGIIFETIDDLNRSNSMDDIRVVIQKRFEGHKPILKSYRSFFQAVNKSELPLKVQWKSPVSKGLSFKLELSKSEMLYQEFKKSLSLTEVKREYRGEIQGVSQWENKVEFLATGGGKEQRISAHFDEKNLDLVKGLLIFNKPRIGVFTVRESINELTDETKTEYFIIDLKRP